jgi:molybdate transport system regulatory protein
MEIRYKIWIEKNGKVVFGRGRDDILMAIEDGHSLNAAARKLEMSYRAAWGRLKASEDRLGIKLVEINTVSKGMQMTPKAKAIISRFKELEADVEVLLSEANNDFMELLNNKNK